MARHATFLLQTAAALTILTATTALQAEEEHRQLGAHEHGAGTFNIAVDGDEVGMELRAPGADIVGFEHAAATDADTAAIDKAKATLKDIFKIVAIPDGAGCKTVSSFAHYTKDPDHAEVHAEHHGEDKGDHHAHDGHHDAGHDGHHKEHHGDHHGHDDGHAEFHAGWELKCASPEKLTPLQFDYFSQFPNAQSLAVNVVTGTAQKSYTATRKEPSLDLDGLF